ncbi:uncharacterized protein LOC132749225, partial [Ruditapes philippinarum]|uniref:uncharacterized protein LOC132749225 n=1 Tax=Ruditapes philippinarum TaxID=129788 RepID=UPI00295BB7E6
DRVSLSIGKAWETLIFEIDIKKSHYRYEATKLVDCSKLQFVLESQFEYLYFLKRLTVKFKFEVKSAGVVQVSGDFVEKNKIEAVWSNLISSVNNALTCKVVESHEFQSKQELESNMQILDDDTKHLIQEGIVGIFLSYEDDACIAKFVGLQDDINKLTQGLKPAVAIDRTSGKGEKSKLGHHKKIPECFQGNIFFEVIDITDDQDTYFEIMGLKELLHEKFPDVKYIKEMNDIITYKFSSTDKKELTKAFSWFCCYRKDIKRKDFDFSVEGFKFISQNKNVQAHLKIKLQKLPSALIISDKIYLICHENDLVNSERIVDDSIKTTVIEGTWSPEAELIKKDSCDKIQVFKENKPGMMIIWYTVDQSDEAKKLIDLVQKYRKYKRKPYSDKQIKAMKALGVFEKLQEEYEDILIRTKDEDIILQGPKMDGVDACFEKLDTIVQQIKIVELNSLPKLHQKLLKNGKVQTYVTEKLKGKIAFFEDGKTVTLENEKSNSSIYVEIKNCFVEMKIDTQCLEHGKGKSFLSEHPEEVVIGDQGNKISCIICYTANLSQEIEQLLYSYSKSCTGIVANCLQLFGDEYCKELEKQNNVGIEVKNDRICVKGPYNRAKSVITEIESHVNTTVLHFGKLDYQRNVLFATDKNKIDSIARSCKCCWKADVFRYEPTELEEKGIDYLCTWNLPRSKEQISIAKIDYNTVKLDVLIIPVNQCLLGEDINGKGIRMYDVHSTQSTQKLGYSEELVLTEKYPCNKYVALVTSEVGQFEKIQTTQLIKSKDLQKSCANIFGKMFRNGLFRVGFALPTSDTNLVGKLEAIIDGFQDITQFYDNMPDSELIFGVKTEAERWMQEVDYISTLKFAPYVRRYISPRYKGLFSSPSLRVQIQKKSILETGAHCIVVAISRDLDLSRGIVSKLVSEACGEQLQEELHSKDKEYLDPWELVMCQSYNMSKNGIQKVIFGFIPEWKHCQKIGDLESFIEDCLLLADSAGCSTVAFPALGTGNLGYPYRDVAVALFNGVDKYVAEGIIGGISTVYISVPQIIKKDVEICQILEREQERRKSAETTSGKQHQAEGNI